MARDERQEVIEHINEKYKEYSGYVGVAVELINPNTDLKATIKEEVAKVLKRLNPISNVIDANIVLQETGNVKRVFANFTSNQISGVIFAVGVVAGVRSGQPEIIALVVSTNNSLQAESEKAINIILDGLDKYILTPIQEETTKTLKEVFIKPMQRAMKYEYFEKGLYEEYNPNNNEDRLQFFMEEYLNFNEYQISNERYAYNDNSIFQQGYTQIATDTPIHTFIPKQDSTNIVESYKQALENIKQDFYNYKPIKIIASNDEIFYIRKAKEAFTPQGISFPYSSIIYLTTIKALKDTLKEYLPKAKKIVLYTPNPFVSLYTSSPFYIFNSNLSFFNPHLQYLLTSKDTQQWLYDTLFNLARDNREIIVYEWGGSIEYNEDLKEKEELDSKESQANKKDLDSKDTNQSTNIQKQTKTYYLSPQGQKLKEKQPYCIRVIAKESKVFTILRDFITSFNTTKEQEVFRTLEILLKDKESLEHLRQCIIKSLKEPIIESIYSLKETKDLNKEELKENVEEVFNNLLGVIEKIYKEGSAYLYKQVLLFFLEIFNLFNIQSVFKKSNALNFGESLALSSNQTLLNVLKWANSKYNYELIHPILKIFTQDLVPLFALIENTMCHNTLILDDKMLIELSSFNLNSYPKIKANLEQNLAICIKSKEAVFGHLEDSHQANQKTANLENTESKEDKQDSLKVDLRDLEVLSLKGISKGENIQIYNQDFITKALAHQMNLDNNRLFYIESPFFNSREVENTKEKVA